MEIKNNLKILGIQINNLTRLEILNKIKFFLSEPKFHQIATINPEFILEAQKNLEFKNILNASDLNVADGIGIKLAFWRFGKKLKYRFAGADLMLEILKIAQEKKLSVFLVVNNDGLSTFEETKKAILKIYPDLTIKGVNLEKNFLYLPANEASFMFYVSCPIVFCNFGAPHQELFINSIKCDTIRLAMGVGGSFDYLTGKTHRAPKFMRLIGLEWLWRLWKQPKRFKRIFNAVFVFSYTVLLNKDAYK